MMHSSATPTVCTQLRLAWQETMNGIGCAKESSNFVQRWQKETIRASETRGPVHTWNYRVSIPDGGYMTSDQQIQAAK